MQLSNGTAHLTAVDTLEPDLDALVRASEPLPPTLRVRLSAIDKLALDGLVDERDAPTLIAWTEASAAALSGPDREDARLRLISRAVAIERARLLVLEALLDQKLTEQRRSWLAIREIRCLVADATRSLCALLREHAAACHVRRHDVMVAVAHVDAINVGPKK